MQSQIRIFSQRVADYLRPAPVVLGAETGIAQVVGRMTAERASSALIVDGEGRLAGIVTEQDVTRRVAFSCTGTEPASAIMTRPVQSVAERLSLPGDRRHAPLRLAPHAGGRR